MSKFWQLSKADHKSAIEVLCHLRPERAQQRETWGDPEFIFVTTRHNGADISEMGQWCEDTGIPYHIEPAGSFTFIELKSDLDAVAFKLRWL